MIISIIRSLLPACVIIIFFFVLPARGQDVLTRQGMREVKNLFDEQYLYLTDVISVEGWGKYQNNLIKQAEIRGLASHISQTLERANSRQFPTQELTDLGLQIQAFNLYVDGICEDNTKANGVIKQFYRNPIRNQFYQTEDAKRYYWKMGIKYGKLSEPANIVEKIVDMKWFSPTTNGKKIADPSPWSPLLRIGTLGYQYHAKTNEIQPSPPILQMGLTRYWFSDNFLVKYINHTGAALSYQYDFASKRNLLGGVVHLSIFDIGTFFDPTDPAAQPVSAANLDLSFITQYVENAIYITAGKALLGQ